MKTFKNMPGNLPGFKSRRKPVVTELNEEIDPKKRKKLSSDGNKLMAEIGKIINDMVEAEDRLETLAKGSNKMFSEKSLNIKKKFDAAIKLNSKTFEKVDEILSGIVDDLDKFFS